MKKIQTKDATIVFGILARDCAEQLAINIPRLETLGEKFKEYHVVVYENDSKDGTTEMLQKWAQKNPNVISINETTKQITFPHQSKDIPYPGQSYSRVSKMAGFRNRVLKEVREHFVPDLFCFIDIDVEKFEPQTVVDAIDNAPEGWGGLFANGQLIIDYEDHQCISPIMYDYFAYMEKGVNPYAEGDYAIRIQDNHAVTWIEQRFINRKPYHQCNSAFNGIGIYRWEAIEGLEYIAYQTPELKDVNASLCEHVSFNYEIVCKGYKMYVVRDMKTEMMHIKPPKIHRSPLSKWKNYAPSYEFLKYNKGIKKKIWKYLFRRLKRFFL